MMILTVLGPHLIVLHCIENQWTSDIQFAGCILNVEEPAARLSTSRGRPLLSASSAMLLGCTIVPECRMHVMICPCYVGTCKDGFSLQSISLYLQAMLPRPMSGKKHRTRQLVCACFCQLLSAYSIHI